MRKIVLVKTQSLDKPMAEQQQDDCLLYYKASIFESTILSVFARRMYVCWPLLLQTMA